jgi:hypothetical protein
VSAVPSIQDVQSYLSDSGWRREPRTWRQATIWSHEDGHEVLVPPRDDLADASLRLREILGVLAQVEQRSPDEIARDISTPFDDTQLYRAVPEGLPDGYIPLDAGVRSLRGIRNMVAAAAEVVIGAASPLPGNPLPTVTEVLRQIRLGPTRAGSYVFTLRLPARDDGLAVDGTPSQHPLLGRQIARQLHQAITSVHGAAVTATATDLTSFESAASAGVTPQLCEALSQLAGRGFQQPFDISFRWARGLPDHPPSGTVQFSAGSGQVIRAGGVHLGRPTVTEGVTMTGVIESLNDEPHGSSRWRIRIRGGGGERPVWARLDSQESYDRAIAAHRAQQRVRVSGEMSQQAGRNELAVADGGLEVLD